MIPTTAPTTRPDGSVDIGPSNVINIADVFRARLHLVPRRKDIEADRLEGRHRCPAIRREYPDGDLQRKRLQEQA